MKGKSKNKNQKYFDSGDLNQILDKDISLIPNASMSVPTIDKQPEEDPVDIEDQFNISWAEEEPVLNEDAELSNMNVAPKETKMVKDKSPEQIDSRQEKKAPASATADQDRRHSYHDPNHRSRP